LFRNKASAQTLEVHGTIARRFVDLVRNNAGVVDFPISDSRVWRADSRDGVSYFSRYALHWESATNKVIRRFYVPYEPGMETVAAHLHDHDPTVKTRLVAYAEQYDLPSQATDFGNWKDEAGLGRYSGSISVRSVGMPTQILLHETAGMSDMAIANVQPAQTADGRTFFPIPHFCVNTIGASGRGRIIQFVDVATNVPHGEATNARAVGVEFVNAPIEAFKLDQNGQVIQPLQPVFDLEHSQRGLYLGTKLGGLSKLFIPMQFSANPTGGFHELALRKDRLVNFATLNGGVGPAKENVVVEDGDNLLLKYAKSDQFEHLLTLMTTLISNGLVRGLDDLGGEAFWKPVVRVQGKAFYIWEHGWLGVPRTVSGRRVVDRHHCFDLREPGVLTHILVGGHVDGGAQGLYGYLRLARRLPVEAALQVIISMLTDDRTAAESAGFKLKAKLVQSDAGLAPSTTNVEKTFKDVLEIDDELLQELAS
jgi:hypothetical protein